MQRSLFFTSLLLILINCAQGVPNNGNNTFIVDSAGTGVSPPTPPVIRDPNIHREADTAVQDLMLTFWISDQFTATWDFAEALDAVADNVRRTHGTHYLNTIDTVFAGIQENGYSQFNIVYYDDENWLAIALLRAYTEARQMPTQAASANNYLQEALRRFDTVRTAEVFDSAGQTQGIWWNSNQTIMNTAANAGAAITACALYEISQDPNDLAMAKRLYDHWFNVAVNPVDYSIEDSVNRDGSPISAFQATSNYGVTIGAALALHKLTGDCKYLTDARKYATYEIQNLSAQVDSTTILEEPCTTMCSGDSTEFKGIGYRYLVDLAEMDPDNAPVQSLLNASAASLWKHAYNAPTKSFAADWAGPENPNLDLGASTSAAIALATLGTTALSQPQGPATGDAYEAEDAYVYQAGLEALYGIYSGWGYVAGWGYDGQAVTFRISVAHTRPYVLDFRYTSNADAIRTLTIPTAQISTNITFPSTAGYTAYNNLPYSVTLPQGVHDVTLAFSTSNGSTNFVNLDVLHVRAPSAPNQCSLPGQAAPQSPVLDSGACGSVQFTWSAATNATNYDVILDGQSICTTTAGTQSCQVALTGTASGRHNWYAVASNNCGTTPSLIAEFNYAPTPVAAVNKLVALQGNHGPVIQWAPPAASTAAHVDVMLNGVLTCSHLASAQCLLDTATLLSAGQNTVVVTVRNACGQISNAPLRF